MKTQQCNNCFKTFKIIDTELTFYDRLNIPLPVYCPDCRAQQRLTYRNERALYQDECDLCHKKIISTYSPESNLPVYCENCYFSDRWDPCSYGVDFDFNKPFFEQFKELKKATPRVYSIRENNENCEFNNIIGDCKNCYLISGSLGCEDCYYGNPYFCKNCVDILISRNCELCYECITSDNLFSCNFCQDCFDSHDLMYCYDCRGCANCLGCTGLRNKEFCAFNKHYSEEEYVKLKNEYNLCNPEKKEQLEKNYNIIKTKYPRRYMIGVKNENVTGNYLNYSKNAYSCFDSTKLENCMFDSQSLENKDCYDANNCEKVELCYQISGGYLINNCRFNIFTWLSNNLDYCDRCRSSENLFGCVSMNKKKYCILNKQYNQDDYIKFKERIIKHMQKTGEWGLFFPIEISEYGYNETVANEYFPIKEENANEKKWPWKQKIIQDYQRQKYRVLLDIQKIDQSICQVILACKTCGKNYKIIPQELDFYKKQNLPIPKNCPDCRHLQRMALRTPRSFWHRQCMCTQPTHNHTARCSQEFETTYSSESKELIYCENCYNREIY